MHQCHDAQGTPIGWQVGSVLGVHAHGLFESPDVLRALFGATAPTLDHSFDLLADMLKEHFTPGWLADLLSNWT